MSTKYKGRCYYTYDINKQRYDIDRQLERFRELNKQFPPRPEFDYCLSCVEEIKYEILKHIHISRNGVYHMYKTVIIDVFTKLKLNTLFWVDHPDECEGHMKRIRDQFGPVILLLMRLYIQCREIDLEIGRLMLSTKLHDKITHNPYCHPHVDEFPGF